MSSIVRIKRSTVSGNPATLAAGELAYSGLADNGSNGGDRLYIGMGAETSGNASSHVLIGGKYFTDMVNAATNNNTISTLVKRDATGNFSAGAITASLIGNASTATTLETARTINGISFNGGANITTITQGTGVTIAGTLISIGQVVDTVSNVTFNQVTAGLFVGDVTGIASSATKWHTGRNLSLTGDATATLTAVDGTAAVSAAITLATVNTNVGTFGSTTTVPVITVNAKGLITSVTTASTSSSLNIAGTTGTDILTLGVDTLTFTGGIGVTTAVTDNAVTFNIGQAVATTSNVTFNQVTAQTFVGTLTGTSSFASGWATARNLSLTGDATATLSGVDGTAAVSAAVTLATVNSNVGSFGGSISVPVITVNGKGLVTSVTTANITPTINIAGTTGTDAVIVGVDTLTFTGGTGVTTAVSENAVTFNIGQAVATNSNVTFNDVTVSGTLNSNDITGANISIAGDANITGNLTVQGTTTTVNSTTVAIGDKNIVLAASAANAAAADGGGITVSGPTIPATLTYSSSNDSWNLNKPLIVPSIYGDIVGNISTATSWATARDLSLTGDATATLTAVNGTANVTAALTLATVNSTVGSFGSSTSVPTIAVNAKGLVTSVSSQAIPTATSSVQGLASFSSSNFTVTSGAVTVTEIDGGTY